MQRLKALQITLGRHPCRLPKLPDGHVAPILLYYSQLKDEASKFSVNQSMAWFVGRAGECPRANRLMPGLARTLRTL